MDFFSIVCGAASLLWLAAGALAARLFDFRFDGYAKAQGAETVLPDTIQSIENWLKEEMGK